MVSKWAFGGRLEASSCRDMDDLRSYVEYAECNRNAMPINDSTRPRVLLMINIADADCCSVATFSTPESKAWPAAKAVCSSKHYCFFENG